jgi:hypothetical protein
VAFDCDTTFALEIHIVEHLCLQVLLCDGVGIFEQTVGKSAFAVVDVSYDAEVTDIFHSCGFLTRKDTDFFRIINNEASPRQ